MRSKSVNLETWPHFIGHKYGFYEVELLNMFVTSGKLPFYGPVPKREMNIKSEFLCALNVTFLVERNF